MKYQIILSDWDTQHFKMPTVKVKLHEEINNDHLKSILTETEKYTLTEISNENNNPMNNYLISLIPNAQLVDINIQLSLKLSSKQEFGTSNKDITFENNSEDVSLINIAKNNIKYSKFFNNQHIDDELGSSVYSEWTKNSLGQMNKYFIKYVKDNRTVGFLLYHYSNKQVVIELLIVDKSNQGEGIGSELLKALFIKYQPGNTLIKVGTQLDNIPAINFYVKNGFLIESVSSVYHQIK